MAASDLERRGLMVRCESGAGGVLVTCWQRPRSFFGCSGLGGASVPDFPGRVFLCGHAWGVNCLRFRLADRPILGHTDERLSGFL